MYADSVDKDLIDFFDHLNFILSNEFLEKWKYLYSNKFLRHFQLKVLHNLNKNKPLKKTTLYNYLTKRCKYGSDQVNNFFDAIDINLLHPLIINR